MKVKIKVRENLGKEWESWFKGLIIVNEKDITVISGKIIDDAALLGY